MKPEKQICSLPFAKRLKELGVKQKSYFAYFDDLRGNPFVISNETDKKIVAAYSIACIENYAAFNVSELAAFIKKGSEESEALWGNILKHINSGNSSISIFAADFLAEFIINRIEIYPQYLEQINATSCKHNYTAWDGISANARCNRCGQLVPVE